VSTRFFKQLCSLLVDPWDPHQFVGYHSCQFCPWEVPEPEPIVVGGEALSMGRLNLFVPGEDCVYVAPSLIAHYIQAHRYSPPKEFVDAVLRCPEMHSEEYLHARRTLPLTEFIKWTSQCREPRSPQYLEALRASGATKLVEWTPSRLNG
jgi:hypothetical protein